MTVSTHPESSLGKHSFIIISIYEITVTAIRLGVKTTLSHRNRNQTNIIPLLNQLKVHTFCKLYRFLRPEVRDRYRHWMYCLLHSTVSYVLFINSIYPRFLIRDNETYSFLVEKYFDRMSKITIDKVWPCALWTVAAKSSLTCNFIRFIFTHGSLTGTSYAETLFGSIPMHCLKVQLPPTSTLQHEDFPIHNPRINNYVWPLRDL